MKKIKLLLLTSLSILALVFSSCETEDIEDIPNKKENSTGVITPSEEDIKRFISDGWVSYTDLGAKGDGKTDDMEAIVATHELANKHSISVKANDNATYFISGKDLSAIIQTNTNFGNSKFIIDDTDVKNRDSHVFTITSTKPAFPYSAGSVKPIKKHQNKIDILLPDSYFVILTNSAVKRYIRYGANQNSGAVQTDVFILHSGGNVDISTPILWDFDKATAITVLPIDKQELTIKGGHFTTIANSEKSEYNYYNRGISVRRSNVVIDGLKHYVTGEGEQGAPYSAFLNINNCTNVTVKNTVLSGHKVYKTIGSAGTSVNMGTYDINVNRAANITFENCSQTNDINDPVYWGIMGSNYSKNIIYDNCRLSRFDAHMGVYNGTIRNSTIGWQGISIIGSGKFIVENSTVNGNNLINLRSDYGSTWDGELFISNCVFEPRVEGNINLIGGSNTGQHNFGYTCYMPERITIENLNIVDSNQPDGYKGPSIFSNFNTKNNNSGYVDLYPYIITKEVILNNVTTKSGKLLRISDNTFMFKDVEIL